MRTVRALALFIGLALTATPSQAILLDPTPERILFMGYPPSERQLTVKIVRRKESYGIYVFENDMNKRLLTREAFAGVVEGSLKGVGLDARAIGLMRSWMAAHAGRPPIPQKIGPYYRYYFEEGDWLLKLTTRRPFFSAEGPPKDGLVSQLMAKRHVAARLEALSRDMDLEHFRLRQASDLRRLGR